MTISGEGGLKVIKIRLELCVPKVFATLTANTFINYQSIITMLLLIKIDDKTFAELCT
jgi:hypothetical protein